MPISRANTRSSREFSTSGVMELSWDVFGELCRALAIKVSQSGYDPELIIGIAKAGVIPGAVIASMLRRDFSSMKITRDVGVERVRVRPKILQAAPREAAGKRVLIVDEICTSGDTLKLATTSVRHVGPADVKTATSFVRVGGFRPDFYALESEATVVFPWDREVVDEGELFLNPFYKGKI